MDVEPRHIAADLLVDVTEPSREDTGNNNNNHKNNLPACWQFVVEFGPAIVVEYFVGENFRSFRQPPSATNGKSVLPRFSETVTTPRKSDLDNDNHDKGDRRRRRRRHAMLVVDIRYCIMGRKWHHLLLQNWWDQYAICGCDCRIFPQYYGSSAPRLYQEQPEAPASPSYPNDSVCVR